MTEEDTFNALRKSRYTILEEAIDHAIGNRYRLPGDELMEILKQHNWKLSDFWAHRRNADRK